MIDRDDEVGDDGAPPPPEGSPAPEPEHASTTAAEVLSAESVGQETWCLADSLAESAGVGEEGDTEALAVDSEGVMDRIDSVSGQIEELMALYRADTLPQEQEQEQAAQL